MLAVGLENDGVLAAADADQDEPNNEIDNRRDQCDGRAKSKRLQRGRMYEAIDCDPGRSNPRNDDEDAFQPGRKELDLLVTVGMRRVRRALRVVQGKVGRQSGKEVDEGLEGIGQETD